MSETNVETNCLDIIEQLKFDRDKYIGMWRSQCQITEQVMKERDDARASTALDVIDRLTAELDRYKQGVEVEVTVDSYDYGDTSFICEDIKLPIEFRGQRVRVLVMKEEG